jgi:hypothetical protein
VVLVGEPDGRGVVVLLGPTVGVFVGVRVGVLVGLQDGVADDDADGPDGVGDSDDESDAGPEPHATRAPAPSRRASRRLRAPIVSPT